MRRMFKSLIAIVMVMIIIVAAIELSHNGADKSALVNNNTNNGSNGIGGTKNVTQTTVNLSSQNVTATSPATVLPGNDHFSISTSYPGMGNASYKYAWNKGFVINMTAISDGTWKGRAAILVFVNKVGANIGPNCMVMTYDGGTMKWAETSYDGSILENGHVLVFATNGSSEYTYHLSVGFNQTGTGVYNVVFQAFDADSGLAISQPVSLLPVNVPPMGGLNIDRVGNGEFNTTGSIPYYEIVLNVTNGWNICHTVYLDNFTLWTGSTQVLADPYRSTLSEQTLEPGQSTQFIACFPTMETNTTLKLTYDDNGTMINVPLS